MSELLRKDHGLPEQTRAALGNALRADAAPGAVLEPKCSGAAEGAECWMELANMPGCYVSVVGGYPNATITWSGGCSGAIAEGRGTAVWTNDGESNEWAGTLVAGLQQGHWTVRYANGGTQEGPYVDGERHGHWVPRYPDGGISEGPYEDGERHGHWVLRFSDGGVDEGPYVDGKRHGHWLERDESGNVSEGRFVDGKKHGDWVERDAYHVRKGSYVDGLQHGRWMVRWDDGRTLVQHHTNGFMSGRWIWRDAHGKCTAIHDHAGNEIVDVPCQDRSVASHVVGSTKIRGVKRRDRPPSESRAGVRDRRLDLQPSMSATLTPRILVLPFPARGP